MAGISTVTVPLYTVTDRQAMGSPGAAWKWQYKGRYQNGTGSEWLQEEEVRDRFTPLQLDVFHALWDTYEGQDCRLRPESAPSKGERDTELRARALGDFPAGTQVGRPFEGADGVSRIAVGQVYDFQAPYWRVRYPDGDWEKLSRREINDGVLRSQSTQHKGGAPSSAASAGQRGKAGAAGSTPQALATSVLRRR